MSTFTVKKGRDIGLKGEAQKTIKDLTIPSKVAVQPQDFKGIKPKVMVKVGDSVKVGTPVVFDKTQEAVKIVSPVSGKVAEIRRGAKRVLQAIIIESDGRQEKETFNQKKPIHLDRIDGDKLKALLIESGLWTTLRQRPFSKLARLTDTPKSIFIHAMNTEPLAADLDFVLDKSPVEFQAGLDALTKLTTGAVNLCIADDAKASVLLEARNVNIHKFKGAHPTGNVSTHIHYVDPIKKGDVVWYVEAQDVVRIGQFLNSGTYPVERIVALTGEGVKDPAYVKTIIGSPLAHLIKNIGEGSYRWISGSVLTGQAVGQAGFLCYYDSQVTLIPEGGSRELVGWMLPGFDKLSFTRTYASSFTGTKTFSLDTDEHGGHRAIVLNQLYDDYNTLDIMTYFLIKSILIGDIEESEKLGLLECDEEDFALCTFACPSKYNVGAVIEQGLQVIEQEG